MGTQHIGRYRGGTTAPASNGAPGSRVYRAPMVGGNLRAVAPSPGDIALASWAPGALIRRRLSSGIDQEWLADSASTCILDLERFPDDVLPLTIFPTFPCVAGSLVANGWRAGDIFVFRNASVTPPVLETVEVTAIGPTLLGAVVLSTAGGAAGDARVYRATQVAGTQRTVPPTITDLGITSWTAGSIVRRRLDSGIEQEWICGSVGAALDREIYPSDSNPLTVFPVSPVPSGHADANGWIFNDHFVYRNGNKLEKYKWTAVGTNLMAVLESR